MSYIPHVERRSRIAELRNDEFLRRSFDAARSAQDDREHEFQTQNLATARREIPRQTRQLRRARHFA